MRDVARQLDIRLVAVVEIGRQDVDVNDPAGFVGIPFRGPIFDGIIADSDNQIRGVEQTVGRLVRNLSNAAAEIVEERQPKSTPAA